MADMTWMLCSTGFGCRKCRAWSVYTLLPEAAAMPCASSGKPGKPSAAGVATRRYRARTAAAAFTICAPQQAG